MASWLFSLLPNPKCATIARAEEEADPVNRRRPTVSGQGNVGGVAVEYYGVLDTSTGALELRDPSDKDAAARAPCVVYTVDSLPAPGQPVGDEPSQLSVLRVVVISDTHELHRHLVLPPGDILIHCGDVLTLDRCSPGAVSNYNLRDFFAWFNRQPFALRIVIGGNHDHQMEKLGRAQVKAMAAPSVYVEDELLDVCGLRIFGTPRSTPNSSTSKNNAFQRSDVDAFPTSLPDTVLKLHPVKEPLRDGDEGWVGKWGVHEVPRVTLEDSERLDVLVSHGSPAFSGERRMLQSLHPAVHLCGHVHSMHGAWVVDPKTGCHELSPESRLPGTLFSFNAASCQGSPGREILVPPVCVDLRLPLLGTARTLTELRKQVMAAVQDEQPRSCICCS